MKKKVLLPFEDHPYSLTYHYCAFPMGIIQANAKEDITPWLCGKNINCQYYKESVNQFTFFPIDDWGTKDHILLGQNIYLYRDLYRSLFKDEILHLRRALSAGYYVSGTYNEEYIPGKWAYQRQYYFHDYLLIGYDDVKKEFVSASYLKDGVFQRHRIPYENMKQALDTAKRATTGFRLWKYNPDAKFELNIGRVINGLTDYLHSTASNQPPADTRRYGMQAVRALAQLYAETANEASQIDIRYTRAMMEHKFYMHMRMEHLLKNKILKDKSYADVAWQVYQMAESVHMLALKFNFTKKTMLVDTIQSRMNDMLAMESEYLPLVLSDLQNSGEVLQ